MASKKLIEKQIEEADVLEAAQADFNAAMGDDWVEQSVGLPPYWTPGEQPVGRWFKGIPMMLDNKDPNFIRYHIQASLATKCFTGPVAEAQEVICQPGEIFSVSAYAGLPLDDYLGFEVGVLIQSHRQLPPTPEIKDTRNFYTWIVKVSPEVHRNMKELKAGQVELLRAQVQESAMRQLQERKENLEKLKSPQLSVAG